MARDGLPMPTNFRAYLGDRRIRTIDLRTYELLYPLLEREALYNNLRAAEWGLGFVPNVHNVFLSSGIGEACLDVLCDKIVPSELKIAGTDPEIEAINKEFQSGLTSKVRLLVRQAATFGSCLGRICFNGTNFTRSFIDSVPLGRFRVMVDESGKVIESTCYIESRKISENDYARYILVDKRYLDKNGTPKAYYGVIKQTFNNLLVAATEAQNFEFKKKDLSDMDLDTLSRIFPDYELYKEVKLPFENYLGVELFNFTETNNKFPTVWFGEPFLLKALDLLYAYDHAFTAKENDKYLARGRAIIPIQYARNDGGFSDFDRDVRTNMQRGNTMTSMPKMYNKKRELPPLDNTFYEEISFGGETAKPESIQFNLRSAEWRVELEGTLGDIASRLHISAVDLDCRVNGATQRTATEVNKDSDITISTSLSKRTLFTQGLNTLIKAYIDVKGLDTNNIDSFIEWPPNGLANPQIATEVISSQVMNGLLSKETAIRKLNPEWTDAEVKEELERIGKESLLTPDFADDKEVI